MQRIAAVIFVLLAALLLAQAALSLQWPITHDEAPLFYEAFLMQNGAVPYRDFFDFQMPGSFIAYHLLGLASGFGPLRIRILDLFILAAILNITFLAMRRFGALPAFGGIILFGLKYMEGGPSLALQREYLILIFLSLALFIGMTDSWDFRKRLLLGLLFGLSAAIKPHASLGLIPFLLIDIGSLRKRPGLSPASIAKESLLPIAIGFVIPVSLVVIWLAFTGALRPFLDIALHYWPLYAQINGEMAVTPPAERNAYLLSQAGRLGGGAVWLLPAALGVIIQRNRQVYLLAGLALCYALYPALSGQFFPYHYIPFFFVIALLSALTLSKPDSPLSNLSLYLLILAMLVSVRPSQAFLRQMDGKEIATSSERAAQIADFLEKNMDDGDTVQPLDWTGGTLLAMLETRAPLATSYVFDFYFYHHVSSPYIQSLRDDFMGELQNAMPRFIVEVTAIDKPWVSGEDTSREFPELRVFLDGHYSITMEKKDYIIYERR